MSGRVMFSVEKWADIPGLEGRYQASSLGRVRSLDRVTAGRRFRGKVLRPRQCGGGKGRASRFAVHVSDAEGVFRQRQIHILVAEAFFGARAGRQVNHINGDPSDNRVANLEYVTQEINMRHAYCGGLTNGNFPRRSVLQIDAISGAVLKRFDTVSCASRQCGVHTTNIAKVCQGARNTAAGYRWAYA